MNVNESFTFNSSQNLNMEHTHNDTFINGYTIPQFYGMFQPQVVAQRQTQDNFISPKHIGHGNLGESVLLDPEFVHRQMKCSEDKNTNILQNDHNSVNFHHAISDSPVLEIGYGQYLNENVLDGFGLPNQVFTDAEATLRKDRHDEETFE